MLTQRDMPQQVTLLRQNRENKLSPTFEPELYRVVQNGNSVIIENLLAKVKWEILVTWKSLYTQELSSLLRQKQLTHQKKDLVSSKIQWIEFSQTPQHKLYLLQLQKGQRVLQSEKERALSGGRTLFAKSDWTLKTVYHVLIVNILFICFETLNCKSQD